MVKKIELYEAFDGMTFGTKEEAENYEFQLNDKIEDVIKCLGLYCYGNEESRQIARQIVTKAAKLRKLMDEWRD